MAHNAKTRSLNPATVHFRKLANHFHVSAELFV